MVELTSYPCKIDIFVLMKQVIIKAGSWVMTVLLVALTTGVTLFTHICFMTGEHAVSTNQVASCCTPSEESSSAALTASCCNDASQFLKFNFTASTHKCNQPEARPLLSTTLSAHIVVAIPLISYVWYRDLPPPETGKDLLIKHSVFLI